MKNQTVKFGCATDSTLTVSLHKGKAGLKVTVRQRTPGAKTLVGCKQYFEFDHEADAQRAFDLRVQEAVAAGWTAQPRGKRATTEAFTAVPPAPGAKPRAVDAPRAAARR